MNITNHPLYINESGTVLLDEPPIFRRLHKVGQGVRFGFKDYVVLKSEVKEGREIVTVRESSF